MRDDHYTTRIRVGVQECDLMIAACDLLLSDKGTTDREVLDHGDAILDLRNRFTEARHRALTLRDNVVDLPLVKPAAFAALANPNRPQGGGAA